ncbi:DUF547 domain-containing protein [Tunicatimonas pelagia]|uniref:DUF547 domain-containing protein n=1 Tax=Tunicatimonas pelagia TaxID=931531 RepID=UPI002666C5B9|nr:DUF547 domain-containing protein [Tunicatimonas pelagia]WKN40997.1 DUF547 domain-containing protein [Tunicatimonas pelagia]
MKYVLTILLLATTLDVPAKTLATFFADADKFLNQWVMKGNVNYTGVKKNFAQIESLYQQIGEMNLSQATNTEKKAFYINAYNLAVIYQVAKYYPLKSPLNKSGFFDQVDHKIAGEKMTLNFLEIKKIVLPYGDPRIHFAVACAAKSCPPLASFAYVPDQLDKQLAERTKKSVNNNEFVQVKSSANQVAVSKIFDWYEKDFTKGGQTIIEFLNKYRSTTIPTSYRVTYYEYDWSLNDM